MFLLIFVLGAAVIAAIVVVIMVVLSKANKLTQRTLDEGDTTVAWIVWAQDRLYRKGDLDGHAKVLISPDADDKLMAKLQQLMIRIQDDGPRDDTEEDLAESLDSESYRPREWTLLLSELTDEATVYMTDVAVEIKDLPKRKLTDDTLRVKVIWDEIGSPVVMIPHRSGKKSSENDD